MAALMMRTLVDAAGRTAYGFPADIFPAPAPAPPPTYVDTAYQHKNNFKWAIVSQGWACNVPPLWEAELPRECSSREAAFGLVDRCVHVLHGPSRDIVLFFFLSYDCT